MPLRRKDVLIPNPYGNPSNWFDDTLQGREVIDDSKTRWRLVEKISERSTEYPYAPWRDCEAQAVFRCVAARGKTRREAIAKVRLQIPALEFDDPRYPITDLYWLRWDRRKYASQAAPDHISGPLDQELQALRYLEANGCTSTPKLLGFCSQTQSSRDWVPGGYIHFMIIEKLPGVTLREAWDPERMSISQKERIWSAFKVAFNDVSSKGLRNYDPRNENALWDDATGKCYIIDLENLEPYTESGPWDDEDTQDRTFDDWGLSDQAMRDRIFEKVKLRREKECEDLMNELAKHGPVKF